MNITLRKLLTRIIHSDKCNFEQKIAFSAMYFDSFTTLDRDIEARKLYIVLGYSRAGENIIKQYDTLDELYNDFNYTAKVMKFCNNLDKNGFWRFVLLQDLQPIDIDYSNNIKCEIVIDTKNLGKQIESSEVTTFKHKVLYEYFELVNRCKARQNNESDIDKKISGDFSFILIRYDIRGDWYIKEFNTIQNVNAYVKHEYFDLKMKAEKEGYYWEYILLRNGEIIKDTINTTNIYSLNIAKHNALLWIDLLNYHENLIIAKEAGYKEGLKTSMEEHKDEN